MWAIAKYIIDNAVSGVQTLLGTANATGGSATAGNTMAKLNAAITNTATNATASKTGTLSQKHAYSHSLLENGTYGLSAIRTLANTAATDATAVKTSIGNATYGLNALKTALNAPRVVKSVQRGKVAGQGTSVATTQTVTISSVNTSKAVVFLDTTLDEKTFHSPSFLASNATLISMTSTQLTIEPGRWSQNGSGPTYDRGTNWQVVEFY